MSAPLDASYHTAGTFDPAVMGFAEGDVTAEWFTAEGFYVVVFSGLDLDAAGPMCPGASLQSNGGFGFIANAPTPDADCSSFSTLSGDPDVRALVCQGLLSFRTAIPEGSAGTLYGTLEKPANGGIIGVTSMTPTDGMSIEAIDTAILDC